MGRKKILDTPEKLKSARLDYQRRYKSKPEIKEYYARKNREWIAKNRTKYNQAKSKYRFKLKMDAIRHYSNGTFACAICGYNADVDALCLDHIENNGAEHRKSLKCGGRNNPAGTTMYERLKALGWLTGLQILCFNCNTIKELRRKRGGITSAEYIEATKTKFSWK